MDPEPRKVVAWLNSPEGRRWSFLKHKQNAHARQWFSFKRDLEYMPDSDDMKDVVFFDLGYYNPNTGRYNKGYGRECTSYDAFYRPKRS